MASKRKSSTPCMVRAPEAMEQEESKDCPAGRAPDSPEQELGDSLAAGKENCENDCEVIEGKSSPANPTKKPIGGYECKYCPYSTLNLTDFTEHIDIQHPNVILNPLYVCAECNFTTKKYDSLSEHNTKVHLGETNFRLKLIKLNNQTVLEQSIEGTNRPTAVDSEYELPLGENNTNRTITGMNAGKPKGEAKKNSIDSSLDGIPHLMTEATEPIACINGADFLQDVVAHVMPSVQLPPNINLVPKVPVPLNSTKYNTALDTNATMINSFNKFPYPTQAELSWLTAASKHPEEQIRIWFATQRLKHGISWSPEEVEEARKKMFNGTIQPAHQTITVLPAQVTATKMSQPLIQTAVPCQILSQTGLVLTQVSNGSTVSPIALAVSSSQGQKRMSQTHLASPESKHPHLIPAEVLPKQNISATPTSSGTMPLSPTALMPSNDRKKTKEQIAALKESFIANQFPDNGEIYRLIEITGLSRSEIKKWFSDHRYRSQRGIVHITSESVAKDQTALVTSRLGRAFSPDITLQKFRGKTTEQLETLEESFLKSSFPTQNELERLRTEVKMSRREIDSWFAERRKLRDIMEQAILDSMGSTMHNKDMGASNGPVSQTESYISPPPTSSSRCSSAFASSSQEQVHLLKKTFARTQWPSPQEYDELAAQTGLTRTEIVRWFKDNRSSLRTGTLKWLDQYQQLNIIDSCNTAQEPKPTESLKNSNEAVHLPNKDHQQLAKQDVEGTERSENSQDNDEKQNDGHVSWADIAMEDGEDDDDDDGDDDDDASDCMDSWGQTVPEGKADFDSESISADNSHT